MKVGSILKTRKERAKWKDRVWKIYEKWYSFDCSQSKRWGGWGILCEFSTQSESANFFGLERKQYKERQSELGRRGNEWNFGIVGKENITHFLAALGGNFSEGEFHFVLAEVDFIHFPTSS